MTIFSINFEDSGVISEGFIIARLPAEKIPAKWGQTKIRVLSSGIILANIAIYRWKYKHKSDYDLIKVVREIKLLNKFT